MQRGAIALGVLLALGAGACGGSSEPAGVRIVVRALSSDDGTTPVAGVEVQVNGQPWGVTGPDGIYRSAPVTPPYDLRYVQRFDLAGVAYHEDDVTEYLGATTPVPLLLVEESPGNASSATVGGSVGGRSGGSASRLRVFGAVNAVDAQADGTFAGLLREWFTRRPRAEAVRAVESDAGEIPAQYFGYGETPVTLVPGVDLAGVAVSLSPVTQGTVSGHASLAAALDPGTLAPRISVSIGRDRLRLVHDVVAPQPQDFAYEIPKVPGATALLALEASDGAGGWGRHTRVVAAPASGIAFDLPAPAVLSQPADGAVVDQGSVFSWAPVEGAGYSCLYLYCSDGGAATYSQVSCTRAAHAAVPAIPGVALPWALPCSWQVFWADYDFDAMIEFDGSSPFGARSAESGPRAATLAPR